MRYAIKLISNQEKYHMFKYQAEPTKNFSFPTSYVGGSYRYSQRGWLNMFPGLVYSGTADRAFKDCPLLA